MYEFYILANPRSFNFSFPSPPQIVFDLYMFALILIIFALLHVSLQIRNKKGEQ